MSWRPVLTGAAVGVAVLAVTVVAAEALDVGTGSNWVFALYAVALAGLGAGGWVAARARPDAPLAHGVLAALLAYAVLVVVGVVVRSPDPVTLAFNGLMAASAGILGTLVAERRSSP